MIFLNKEKGFTLIELLVVVSIIGVLSTIVLGSLTRARIQSRDNLRFAQAKSIQNALELYYLDNGDYPRRSEFTSVTSTSWVSNCKTHSSGSNINEITTWNDFMDEIAPYMSSVPQNTSDDWPRCIYYIDNLYSGCNPGRPEGYEYVLLVGASAEMKSEYSFPHGADPTLARHCIYSI